MNLTHVTESTPRRAGEDGRVPSANSQATHTAEDGGFTPRRAGEDGPALLHVLLTACFLGDADVSYRPMFGPIEESSDQTAQRLSSGGYWPAQAAVYLAECKYSRAVEICNTNLAVQPDLISGRLILAKALLKAGQIESASRQFSQVLARDANNLVALKFLGDIKFAEADTAGAMALYSHILEIDPDCRGLRSPLERTSAETTRTITLKRVQEDDKPTSKKTIEPRLIPFYTETIGDLYLQQGHSRLAAQVFQAIAERNPSPRIADKLAEAEQRISEKDH